MNRISNPKIILFRWLARIWSLAITFTLIMFADNPDVNITRQAVSFVEWFLLSMYAFAALGLLLAWRWEGFGGALAILCMAVEIFGFRIVKGMWYPDWFGFAVPLIGFVLPAALFLFCWSTTRHKLQVAT